DVAVPLHGPADVGDLDADVPDTANRKSLGHLDSLLATGEALIRSVPGHRHGYGPRAVAAGARATFSQGVSYHRLCGANRHLLPGLLTLTLIPVPSQRHR